MGLCMHPSVRPFYKYFQYAAVAVSAVLCCDVVVVILLCSVVYDFLFSASLGQVFCAIEKRFLESSLYVVLTYIYMYACFLLSADKANALRKCR